MVYCGEAEIGSAGTGVEGECDVSECWNRLSNLVGLDSSLHSRFLGRISNDTGEFPGTGQIDIRLHSRSSSNSTTSFHSTIRLTNSRETFVGAFPFRCLC